MVLFQPNHEAEMRSLDAPFWESAESFLRARHDLKPWTLKSYEKSLRRFDKWISCTSQSATVRPSRLGSGLLEPTPLSCLTSVAASTYTAGNMSRGKRTLAHHDAVALVQLAKWLVESRVLRSDPLVGFKVPKQPVNRRQPFSDFQVGLIIDAARKGSQSERDVTIVALALACGLRLGELLALSWPVDVDLRERMLFVRQGKTDSAVRQVPISARVVPLIDAYVKDWRPSKSDGPLFLNNHGDPFSYDGFSQVFRRIRRRLPATVDFKIHRARNTALTNWRRMGVDIYTVSKLAGHKKVAHTERYFGDMTTEEIRRVPDAFSKYGRTA